jgi:hypothetical protein
MVHEAAIALHFTHYNFARIHQSLRINPLMAAGISDPCLHLGRNRRISRITKRRQFYCFYRVFRTLAVIRFPNPGPESDPFRSSKQTSDSIGHFFRRSINSLTFIGLSRLFVYPGSLKNSSSQNSYGAGF